PAASPTPSTAACSGSPTRSSCSRPATWRCRPRSGPASWRRGSSTNTDGGAPHMSAAAPVADWPRRVAIVGAGAMGRALAAGLVAAVAEAGGRPATLEEAAGADLVCLAVKPKDAEAALGAVREAMGPRGVLLSVVAGWDLDRLAGAAPGVPLVRTMPNLAVR